jgi:GNAT superfamily N-acetyltransferase
VTAALGTLPVEIRPANGFADWEDLLALLRRAFAFMEGRIDPPSSLHRLDAAGLAAKARAERCLLAFRGGQLVGCAFCEPRRASLYIGKLAVEPKLQGQGIGRALLARAEAEARALGLPALELQTRIELVENHRAFGQLGFVRTGETAHAGFARPTSVTMRKALE